MESYTIFRDVGDSLRKLIHKNMSSLLEENAISFDSPADIESANSNRLCMFLYRAEENKSTKNLELQRTSTKSMKFPPMVVDLHYLFVPFAQNRETEMMIVERLLQLFNDNPVLEGERLQGSLATTGNERIKIVPEQQNIQDIYNLWSMLAGKMFKLSAFYILSPVKIPSMRKKHFVPIDRRMVVMEKSD